MKADSTGKAAYVIFVRHGEAENNQNYILSGSAEGYSLTEKGVKEVKTAESQLRNLLKVDEFRSSPVTRTRETAALIREGFDAPLVIERLIAERGFGKYEGVKFSSRAEIEDVKDEQIENGYPDWESWENMESRMSAFLDTRKEDTLTIAVSHGDPIKAAASAILGKNEKELRSFHVPRCSFTVIECGEGGRRMVLALAQAALPKELLEKLY